ncbi:DAK2 domain-containing protein, partial [Georgenia sp. 10Sc9-8]|nr:DAK2 domain-containing protein [Georgenia halotolerans]
MSTPLTTLDGPAGRRWFEHALRSLLLVRGDVNELNVFPVPDADTGTNLVLTLAAAAEATRELPADADLGALVGRAADGALLGARGSSGVILSQALQAIALELAGRGSMDGRALAAALASAAGGARSAVSRPVEGTILTVAAAAADGARDVVDAAHGADEADGSAHAYRPVRAGIDAAGRASLLEVVQSAVERARTALAGTNGAHGGASVDAGAAGYMVVLDALADVVRGAAPTTTRSDALRRALAVGVPGAGPTRPGPVDQADAEEHGAGEFEVMYVLRADGAQAAELREHLCRVGCAVAVVGQAREDVGLWQVHVHTDTPERTLSTTGSMRQVGVRHLRRPDRADAPALGVVACTRAPGLLAPLARTGAVAVLDADVAGVRRAVEDVDAADVVVLPCDESSARAAAGVDGGGPHRTAQHVHVATSSDDVHVLAVAAELGVADGEPGPAAALSRVEEIRSSTRTGTVTPGPDGLQPRAVTEALTRVLLGGPELLTVVVGEGVPDGIVDLVRR